MDRKVMYLRVNINDDKRDKLNAFFENNNIESKEFETPLSMFCWEEAAYRLKEMSYNILVDNKEKFIQDNQDALADALYNNDYTVDGEQCESLTIDFLNNIDWSKEADNYEMSKM